MQIWFGRKLPESSSACALTIGNFDGVHLGHRHILQRLNQEARQRGLKSTVLVFEPQPQEFFARQGGRPAPPRLTPLREKLALLAATGLVEQVWVLRFDAAFARLSAEDFIRDMLLTRLNTRYLLVGDDFRFGQNRSGDFELLARQDGFITERTPTVTAEGGRISSTRIRGHLSQGCLNEAQALLGHAYTLGGRVKHGAKLGRELGCPTANIHLPPHHYALSGVFAVQAGDGDTWFNGVASFGTNPTVSDTPDAKLEVHIFDFNRELYGRRLSVRFLHKLRDEAKFADETALRYQIEADIKAAKRWLAANGVAASV